MDRQNYSILFFAVAVPFLILWWSLDPRSEVVSKEAKLAQAGQSKVKKYVERGLRIFGVLIGIFFLKIITVPLAVDINGLLHQDGPQKVAGFVSNNDFHAGTSFLRQSIMLEGDQASDGSYTLLYFLDFRAKKGDKVRLLVLPHSRMVLEARRAGRNY